MDQTYNQGLSLCNQDHVYCYLQDAGVRRIAVGIGSNIHYGELLEIAGSGEDVLQVRSYGDLINKLENIMRMACENQQPGKQTTISSLER